MATAVYNRVDVREQGVRRWSSDEVRYLLGPAEAQYGQSLVLGFEGNDGPIACGGTIVDQSADDLEPGLGTVRYRLVWNDLAGETGYRAQVDEGSVTFLAEDAFEEEPANVTQTNAQTSGSSATHTFRVLGHVGHAPGHGETPIAGDVVSNECVLTISIPATD
jgi:hypothetical protein